MASTASGNGHDGHHGDDNDDKFEGRVVRLEAHYQGLLRDVTAGLAEVGAKLDKLGANVDAQLAELRRIVGALAEKAARKRRPRALVVRKRRG